MFQDERGGPQHPLGCRRCGVTVLVKKHSLAHTVVQWTSATDACTELGTETPVGALVPSCPFLRDTIESAVLARDLEVGDLARPDSPD